MQQALAGRVARLFAGAAVLLICSFTIGYAASPPSAVTIGTLYASTGPFAVSFESEYNGLQFWAAEANKDGGVFVKAFDKKIPIKITAYDDQSSTSTATTLYNQLITQDKVDILVADFGSVLTSVAIPLAAEHHTLLIDPTGSGANFFREKTDYLAEVSLPASSVWPESLGQFLLDHKIKRVAIIYGSNDFDASQGETLKSLLVKGGVNPVYFHAVPTTESNYLVLLHTMAAERPDAVIEFGYPDNDIAFLRALSQSGLHFDMVFTVFPGQLLQLLTSNVGVKTLAYTLTYPTAPLVQYKKVTDGMNTADFVSAYKTASGKEANFLTIAGYNAGVIIQKMLATSPEFTQLSFHSALRQMSGHTSTLVGDFDVNENGAQVGELLSVAQLQPEGTGLKVVVVYPPDKATGELVYPAPRQ
ncbi:MAG: ABC transporter substrate-binding protein [Acetobacteraceae bacterium]